MTDDEIPPHFRRLAYPITGRMGFHERHAALYAILGPAFIPVTFGQRINGEETLRFSLPATGGGDGR